LIVLTGGKITRNTCSKENTERLEVDRNSKQKELIYLAIVLNDIQIN
jgi:hypothetical protein